MAKRAKRYDPKKYLTFRELCMTGLKDVALDILHQRLTQIGLIIMGGFFTTVFMGWRDKPKAEADYQCDRNRIVTLKPQLDAALDNPTLTQQDVLAPAAKFVFELPLAAYGSIKDKNGRDFLYYESSTEKFVTRNTVDIKSLHNAVDANIDDFMSEDGKLDFVKGHQIDHVCHMIFRYPTQEPRNPLKVALEDLNVALQAKRREPALQKAAAN